MKTSAAMLLATAAIAAGALPMVAQDGTEAPTVISNAEFCALVSEDGVACEGILTGMAAARVLPQAFADIITIAPGTEPVAVSSSDPSAAASLEPSADASVIPSDGPVDPEDPAVESTEAAAQEGDVGDTLARDDLRITLLKAEWKPDISDSFYQPGKGRKYVSFLVRYEALEDGARYEIINWDALDKSGKRYEAEVLGQITPDLKVGDLEAGEKVQGWVTYEVPQDVNQLRIIESQVLKEDLAWTSKR